MWVVFIVLRTMDSPAIRHDLVEPTHARFREAGENYCLGTGDMTVCKLLKGDAGVELRVEDDRVASREISHPDDGS